MLYRAYFMYLLLLLVMKALKLKDMSYSIFVFLQCLHSSFQRFHLDPLSLSVGCTLWLPYNKLNVVEITEYNFQD